MDETDISLVFGFAVRKPDDGFGSLAGLPAFGVTMLARDAAGIVGVALFVAPSLTAVFGVDVAAEFTLLFAGILACLATVFGGAIFDAGSIAGLALFGRWPVPVLADV